MNRQQQDQDTDGRVSVVVLTHNRAEELRCCLQRLQALPERPPLVVVDNASSDDTPAMLRREFAGLRVLRCARNLGAAARNLGVALVRTPYVAFSDDDTAWQAGSLAEAARVLDAEPRIGVLVASLWVGEAAREDPVNQLLAASPLPRENLPGPALLGLLAGASVMRREAFMAVGGYWAPLFIGGEESLLAYDLRQAGWHIVYLPQLRVRHWPSPHRDHARRRWLLRRNAIWIAGLRLPWMLAAGEIATQLKDAASERCLAQTLWQVLPGLPRVLSQRCCLQAEVLALYRCLRRAAV